MKSNVKSISIISLIIFVISSGVLVSFTSIVVAQSNPLPMIYVGPGGSDSSGNGSFATPYATISHAVSAAPVSGSTVIVEAGVYDEMINITKPITLQSESAQPSNTIINAIGKLYGIFLFGSGAAGTVIQGLTVENADNHGIFVQDTSQITIVNNDVLHNGLNPTTCPDPPTPPTGPCIAENKAIELVGTSNSIVANNLVANNQADGAIGISDDGRINPGGLTSGASNPAVGNVISGNTLTSNVGGCGVVVAAYDPGEGVTNNIVTGNHVVNGYAGIVIAADVPQTSAINNTVVANTVLDNQLPGIIIHSNTPGDVVSGTLILRNIISGNGGFGPQPTGITLIGAVNPVVNTTISGNIVHNEYFGIDVANATNTRISENLIDSTVSTTVTDPSATSPMTITTSPMTTNQQTGNVDTAMLVGTGGLVLAVIALAVALTTLRKRVPQ
jgi:parallel beta-helix repeat protein